MRVCDRDSFVLSINPRAFFPSLHSHIGSVAFSAGFFNSHFVFQIAPRNLVTVFPFLFFDFKRIRQLVGAQFVCMLLFFLCLFVFACCFFFICLCLHVVVFSVSICVCMLLSG